MEDKTLRGLSRRELLQMLLVQCEETERLQQEQEELKGQMETVMESYERLKKKLDVKDERLNQKDARIAELGRELEEMQNRKTSIPEGSLAEAVQRIDEIFGEAQKAAGQYLMGFQMPTAAPGDPYGT